MQNTEDSCVYVVDEIDRSLHPNLAKELIKNYLDSESPSKSQLILTTHETALLDNSVVRRDEIWFIEKANNGSSELYSLDEYKERPDKDIRKAYLLGRYGSVPDLGNLSSFFNPSRD